jgi:hypothetical protein
MGLDMYLYADKYVSRKSDTRIAGTDYDYYDNEAFATIVSTLEAQDLVDNEWTGLTVSLPIGYWRKANAIHNWIVQNCADGVDECQRIYISQDKAKELVDTCKKVIKTPSLAGELLPPTAGFFFGSLDIDEWYVNDLKRTIEIFEKAFNASDIYGVTYQASW